LFTLKGKAMEIFNSARLKNARLLAGLSLRQLAALLDEKVSYNSINKYEKGEMQPEIGTVLRLSQCLKVSPSYLYEKDIVQLGQIDFRKKSSLSAAAIEQIKIKSKDKVQRFLEVEQLLNIPYTFKNPVGKLVISTPLDAEAAAEGVRSAWELGTNPIPNVIEMLEENEVKVIEVEAPEKFDGLSTYINGSVPVAVVNELFTTERKRFTVLHELGHLLLNMQVKTMKEAENACNRFANSVLVPKSELFKLLGKKRKSISMGELIAIKEEYGISIHAIVGRALDLEIITPGYYRFFCITMAKNKREEGLGVFKGTEKSNKLLQLVFRAASENLLTMEKAAQLAGLPMNEFTSLFYGVPVDDLNLNKNEISSTFSRAWEVDEPEYSLDDIKTINPGYAGW
jgi:Zn-dependent peptidase ImmA (M78 family)/DNA-binding XRE family transcriptional regulator